jgi:copper homeostasis protein CutC
MKQKQKLIRELLEFNYKQKKLISENYCKEMRASVNQAIHKLTQPSEDQTEQSHSAIKNNSSYLKQRIRILVDSNIQREERANIAKSTTIENKPSTNFI